MYESIDPIESNRIEWNLIENTYIFEITHFAHFYYCWVVLFILAPFCAINYGHNDDNDVVDDNDSDKDDDDYDVD